MTERPVCTCDQQHFLLKLEAYELLAKMDPLVDVIVGDETYKVPRVFIASHGIQAWKVPDLATKYGWEKVDG